ncbi:MAG: hypothetical protein WAK60_03745 [Sedimentisphaerales bacterium]
MLKSWSFLVFSMFFFCSSLAGAQDSLDSEQLLSSAVGQRFYEIAYQLADSEDINGPEAEQAIIFLTATMALDSGADYVYPLLIKLAAKCPARDYSEMVYDSLTKYLNKSSDFEPARQAVQYLLERLNSREQREQLLEKLLKDLGGKNACFDSEVVTLLGLLVAEKADANTAQAYFVQAFNRNNYNRLAFAKLVEFMPDKVAPATYLGHLRLVLVENPFNLENALAFAQYAGQIQLYQTAADAYEYCARLFGSLYPSQELPSYIYLPWMLSNYNTPRNQNKCLQIISQLRKSKRFDLFAEAIAGKAAAKIGDTEQAYRIIQAAEEKISSQSSINSQSVAWFYCFVLPDANKALAWANKAYAAEPNSATTAAVLAYSLVMNKQTEWAKLLIDKFEHTQIADLSLAQIQLAEGQRDLAVETLKTAIARDPGSLLEAERAKEILTRIGGEYSPPVDPVATLTVMKNAFGQAIVPAFTKPEKIISVQLKVFGSDFSYGSRFDGTLAITNNSSVPLMVSDDGLFTGSIRVDANLTGDLNEKIPELVSIKIRPASPVEPGKAIFVPLHLLTTKLNKALITHPQASVNMEFTLYLDPVTTDQGRVTNHLRDLKPVKVIVRRPRVEITDKFLQNRLDSFAKGQEGLRIKTAQLFIGLLREQYEMANGKPPYKFVYTDQMPALLKSALLHNLTSDDWVVKACTMADMTSLPLDYDLMNAMGGNLDDAYWPTRLMAVYLLSKNPSDNFAKVLDYTAKCDSSNFVQDMAVALGGTAPPLTPQELAAKPKQPAEPNREPNKPAILPTQKAPQQQPSALGGTSPQTAKPAAPPTQTFKPATPPTQTATFKPAEPNKPAAKPTQQTPQQQSPALDGTSPRTF